MAKEASSPSEAGERLIGLIVIAQYAHVDVRYPQIGTHLHACDSYKAQARISRPSLNEQADFFV